MPFSPTLIITNPVEGDLADFEGQAFVQTGNVVSVKVTSFQIRGTAKIPPPAGGGGGGGGGTPSAGNILVAMTKTGDFTAATSFHSFPVTLDANVYDLGTIDFTSELSLTNAEAASGLIGVIIDWSGVFNSCAVELAQPTVQLGFSVQAGQTTGSGLIYAEYSNCDEYVAIISGGIHSINGQYVDGASANNWSGNLTPSGTTFNALFWEGCQFGPEEFITEPSTGVFRRNICGKTNGIDDVFVPLYQDYQNPGSNGAALAQIIQPPYVPKAFDHVVDSIVLVANTTAETIVPSIDPTSNKPTFKITSSTNWAESGYYEFDITLATAVDWSRTGQYLEYLMLHYLASQTLNGSGVQNFGSGGPDTTLGFQSSLTKYQIKFADASGFVAGHQTASVTCSYMSTIANTVQKDLYGFFDLNATQATYAAVMAAVKKIRIRFGPRGQGRPDYLRLDEFIPLGQYYHYDPNSSKILNPGTDPKTDGPVLWAYNYTEGATIGKARAIQATAVQALGTKPEPAVPYGGSFINITIPGPPPAPFSPAALQNIYRKTSLGYQLVASSAGSSNDFIFSDTLTDSEIILNPSTYPVTVLDFDPLTAADSGQATNMINCVSAFGSLIFFGTDGQAYGSATNDPQLFFWPFVNPDLTDIAPNEVPRTLQIANNRGLPVLVGVYQGSLLYMFTRKEGYTMRSLDTFAVADFPSKTEGCRGVVGTRAACAYGAGCLFGSDDGLWYVAVNPYQPTVGGETPPDALTEITAQNRGLWSKLIGDATQRVKLVVQVAGEDIWCFCESRYIHIDMRRGRVLTYGEWATGKQVSMARGDPKRGMVILFSDGTMGVTGEYLTDGALDVNGATGNPPLWRWRGRRFTSPLALQAMRCVWENQLAGTQPSMGQITAFSARGSVSGDSIDFTDADGFGTKPFDPSIVSQNKLVGGDWFELELSGAAWDKVTRLELHATQDQGKTMKR